MAVVQREPVASPYRVLDFGQVQVQIQVAAVTEQSLAAHLASETKRIKTLLASRPRDGGVLLKSVVINDASCNIIPPPTVRKVQAEWMKENEALLGLVCHAVGFVVPGNVLRNLLTGMFWFAPLPMPIVLHETLDLAIDWAITEADKAGGQISNDLLMNGAMAIERARLSAAR